MNRDLYRARLALRRAMTAVRLASTDFDRAVAHHSRARAARLVRSELNVEKPLPALLRPQA